MRVVFALLFVIRDLVEVKSTCPVSELISNLHTCKRHHQPQMVKLAQCIAYTIESMRPHLVQGIPELRIEPLEPRILYINDDLISKDALSKSPHELKIKGLTNFIINNVKILENRLDWFEVDAYFPSIRAMVFCQLSFPSFKAISIQKNVNITIDFVSVVANTQVKGIYYKKVNKERYLHINNIVVNLMVENVNVKWEPKRLPLSSNFIRNAIHLFMDENMNIIKKKVWSAIKLYISYVIRDVVNKISNGCS